MSMQKTDDNRVKIFDTTLRDGEQSPGFSMNHDEKLRMAAMAGVGMAGGRGRGRQFLSPPFRSPDPRLEEE